MQLEAHTQVLSPRFEASTQRPRSDALTLPATAAQTFPPTRSAPKLFLLLTMHQVKDGVFGAMMNVELVNDGPVTIILVISSGAATLANIHS